jgi:hypothetical protein
MIVDGDDMDLNVQRTFMVSGMGKNLHLLHSLDHSKSKLIVDPKTNNIHHVENDGSMLNVLRIYFNFSVIAFLMQNISNTSMFSVTFI